jgi:hypothetical protein
MLDLMILDYYHLREHAIVCAKRLYGEGTPQARLWRQRFCQTLLQTSPLDTGCLTCRNFVEIEMKS